MNAEDQFRLLAGLSLVDGRLQGEEEQVLLRAADGLGLGRDRAAALVRELMQGGKISQLAAPADPEERAQLFQNMVALVTADGQVTPQERVCLERMGPTFGVDPARVNVILQSALLPSKPPGAPSGAGTETPRSSLGGRKQKSPQTGAAECPSCGAPVEFKNTRSVAVVCEYCDTTVAREDAGSALEDLGKISHVKEDASPIQLGTRGEFQGVQFTVLGRLQIEHEVGFWNEWYLEWADRKTGWLGEALGQYQITFPTGRDPGRQGPRDLPRFDELQVGMRLYLDKKRYTVTEIRRARATGTQGETPFVVSQGYDLPYADLRQGQAGFATLDYSEDPPLVFVGRCVRWRDLNMRNYRSFDGWRS